MSSDTLKSLNFIHDSVSKLVAQGWKQISIIDIVDRFFGEDGRISNLVLTDIYGNVLNVPPELYNGALMKPGFAVLFKGERVSEITKECGFLPEAEVKRLFASGANRSCDPIVPIVH